MQRYSHSRVFTLSVISYVSHSRPGPFSRPGTDFGSRQTQTAPGNPHYAGALGPLVCALAPRAPKLHAASRRDSLSTAHILYDLRLY